MVYAERAANHWKASLDMGGNGLWSDGMDRVPSGSLLVLGPLEVNQQSWSETARHLEMACLRALNNGHRVAVLLSTPAPEDICEDVFLMVCEEEPEGALHEEGLAGIVTEDGHMQQVMPFARPRSAPAIIRPIVPEAAIPERALSIFRRAIGQRKTGLILLGSTTIQEHRAIDLVAHTLALTEHVGPAARIMSRSRGTPEKDWMVPDAVKQLPFLPSVESAYDRGYRRLIIDPYYSGELVAEYGHHAMFIAGTYAADAVDAFLVGNQSLNDKGARDMLALLVAAACVTKVPLPSGDVDLVDLFAPEAPPPLVMTASEVDQYIIANRLLDWRLELEQLLDSGAVTPAAVKKVLPSNRHITAFFEERTKSRRTKTAA